MAEIKPSFLFLLIEIWGAFLDMVTCSAGSLGTGEIPKPEGLSYLNG